MPLLSWRFRRRPSLFSRNVSWPEIGLPLLAIVVPTDNPEDPRFRVEPGQGYDGVVLLRFPDGGTCTGALLVTGRHILTAAHCFEVRQQTGVPNLTPSPADVTVYFDLRQGREVVRVARAARSVTVHPEWDNTEDYNNDLAIIELAELAPLTAERYPLYRRQDEVGERITRVGYGARGTGRQGEDPQDPTTVKRVGMNRYDTLGETLNQSPMSASIRPGTQLVYDFDNGLRRHDAMGVEYGLYDLGVVEQAPLPSLSLAAQGLRPGYEIMLQEVGTSTGDSGGPSFLRGRIAGVASNGFSPKAPGIDVTPANDTSFGEYFFDTRVSAYVDFIEATMGVRSSLWDAARTEGSWGAGMVALGGLPLVLGVAIARYCQRRRGNLFLEPRRRQP